MSTMLSPNRLGASLLGAALGGLALLCGCGQAQSPLPSEFVTFKYNVSGGGVETGERVVVMPVAAGTTLCGRANSQLYIVASAGAANIAIKLNGNATAANNTGLQATAASKGVAEVVLNLPTVFDQTGNGTSPLGFTTTMTINPISCTLSLIGNDPFASLDGSLSCASITGASGSRLVVSEGSYHVVSCP